MKLFLLLAANSLAATTVMADHPKPGYAIITGGGAYWCVKDCLGTSNDLLPRVAAVLLLIMGLGQGFLVPIFS